MWRRRARAARPRGRGRSGEGGTSLYFRVAPSPSDRQSVRTPPPSTVAVIDDWNAPPRSIITPPAALVPGVSTSIGAAARAPLGVAGASLALAGGDVKAPVTGSR